MPAELDRGSPADPVAPTADRPVRVVLADGHRLVSSGLALLLDAQDDLAVVAQAGDVDGALRAVLGNEPDVLVLELAMHGGASGLRALPAVRLRSPSTATVVLTNEEDPNFARHALRAGALSFVVKTASLDELCHAIRRAAVGQAYINPSLGALLATMPEPAPTPPDDLSEREFEVLRLIAFGHTNAAIGEQLFLSVRTVETHRSHVQHKLGCTKRKDLDRYALDHGMLHDAA